MCQPVHKSLRYLLSVLKTLIVSGAQPTKGRTRSPIELFWTAKKHKFPFLLWISFSPPTFGTERCNPWTFSLCTLVTLQELPQIPAFKMHFHFNTSYISACLLICHQSEIGCEGKRFMRRGLACLFWPGASPRALAALFLAGICVALSLWGESESGKTQESESESFLIWEESKSETFSLWIRKEWKYQGVNEIIFVSPLDKSFCISCHTSVC